MSRRRAGPLPPVAADPAVDPAVAGTPANVATAAATGADHRADGADDVVERARTFAHALLAQRQLDTGEPALAHADGTATVLRGLGCAPAVAAAAYLVYAGDVVQQPRQALAQAFGEPLAELVALTRELVALQRAAHAASTASSLRDGQVERVRRMLLAFSRDLRVVLLRLASRLQTLRWHAASRQPCPPALATETLQVFAPLAGRLGIGALKWELEDLSFRFLHPQHYHGLAERLAATRAQREQRVETARRRLQASLREVGIDAEVLGRAKHLYSIWRKMQRKRLPLERVFDALALRVLAADEPACYAALARVHAQWSPVVGEFDDYIARPKGNGYRSLHTVVRDADGQALEIQIRTRAMHAHAEHGVAAHWLYKETGVPARVGDAEGARIADARRAVLRELLAWEADLRDGTSPDGPDDPRAAQRPAADPGTPAPASASAAVAAAAPRVYVFTPQARVIELTAGATPVDFAYALHTDLGHRCRGAHVDGLLVPLNTPLRSGQTVSIIAAREGGPSRDWLNPELGHLASPRARAKVRAWFNAQAQAQTVARGREAVERLLQREGRTAVDRDRLAEQLGFRSADALFEVVGKDELSLRTIETLLRPAAAPPAAADAPVALQRSRADAAGGRGGGVLVVGVDSLLTTLPRCCRPAPPDAIVGYVTRGHGVAVHRRGCAQLRQMAQTAPDRVIDVAWGVPRDAAATLYPMTVQIDADDRPGLLRDVSEVFTRERINVTGVHTHSSRDRRSASMTFQVEAASAARLAAVLPQLHAIAGVRHARRP